MPDKTKRSSLSDSHSERYINFQFQLTYEEAREAFLLIIDRRSHTSRLIMGGVLLILALVSAILYGRNPYGLQFALAAILFALFAFLVLAYPALKAGRAAKSVTCQGGTYKLKLSPKGYFILPDNQKLLINGDRLSRVLESDTLFAIRPDRFNTVCLPKRTIQADDISQVRAILQIYAGAYHDKSAKRNEYIE